MEMTTIGQLLEWSRRNYPHKLALKYPAKEQAWTYEDLNAKVNQFAHALLGLGVKKGDVVSIFTYNSSEFVVSLFASAKIGAIFNPINYRLVAHELQYILNDAQSKVLIYETAVEEVIQETIELGIHVEHFVHADKRRYKDHHYFYQLMEGQSLENIQQPISEEDIYIMMYTSGTTGRPKGVLHRHRSMVHHSFLMQQCMGITERDIGLSVAPLNHTAELHTSYIPRVHVGASNVILRQFDAEEVLRSIEEEKISHMFAAPTMVNMMLNVSHFDSYDLSSLRLLGYGGASMAPILIKTFLEKTSAELVQMLGTTEMGPVLTVLFSHEQLERPGSAGKAILSHEVRIVKVNEDGSPSHPDQQCGIGEVGEIIVRGPCMMLGYHNRKQDTEEALAYGWYHTGDMGSYDEDGYIWVHDRMDYMINSGAENIFPREIEDFLLEHPDVLDVSVIGKPDPNWGEIVVAFVVRKDKSLTREKLEAYALNSKKIARYKRPREYYFIDELPKTASGKVQKFVLRSMLTEKIGGDV